MRLPATLHKAGGEQVPVTILNLSRGGAFVAVPAERTVLCGLVGLELCVPGNDPGTCLWRAWVMRQQPDGAGLMFDDRELGARLPFLAAQRLLRQAGR